MDTVGLHYMLRLDGGEFDFQRRMREHRHSIRRVIGVTVVCNGSQCPQLFTKDILPYLQHVERVIEFLAFFVLWQRHTCLIPEVITTDFIRSLELSFHDWNWADRNRGAITDTPRTSHRSAWRRWSRLGFVLRCIRVWRRLRRRWWLRRRRAFPSALRRRLSRCWRRCGCGVSRWF